MPSPFSSDGYEQSLLSASVEKEVTRSREEEAGRGGGGRGEREKDGLRILGLVQNTIAASYNTLFLFWMENWECNVALFPFWMETME